MERFQSVNDLLDHVEAKPEELVLWLESDPDASELKELAAEDDFTKPTRPPVWVRLAQFALPNFRGLHGRAYVDATLKQDVENKAKFYAATNGLTVIPAIPIIGYGFSGLGLLGYGLAAGFTGLLFGATNWTVQQAVTERPREQRGGRITFMGLLALQLIPSLLSGPGSVLLLERASLAQNWAETTVEQKVESDRNLQHQQLTLQKREAGRKTKECRELEDELQLHPEGSAIANRLYLQARGRYEDANIDRSAIPLDQLQGVCWVAQRLEVNVAAEQQMIEDAYTQTKQDISLVGALRYMEKHYPDLYALHVKPDGTLLSGTLATQLATQLFISELRQGHIGALLIPTLFFLLSTTTSLLMVLKLWSYRSRKDVLRSFDPSVALFRDELFHRAQIGLMLQQRQLEESDDCIDITDQALS